MIIKLLVSKICKNNQKKDLIFFNHLLFDFATLEPRKPRNLEMF